MGVVVREEGWKGMQEAGVLMSILGEKQQRAPGGGWRNEASHHGIRSVERGKRLPSERISCSFAPLF